MHDEFELEIEMRLHGALDAARAAALDAHLATCAECRAFEKLSKETEKTMTANAMAQVSGVDWAAIQRRLRGKLWGTYVEALGLGLGLALVFAPAAYFADPFMRSATIIPILGLAVFLAYRALQDRAEMRGYLQEDDLRFLLDQRSETMTAGRGKAWLVVSALAVVQGALELDGHLFYRRPHWLGAGLSILLGLGSLAWLYFLRVPALKRDREATQQHLDELRRK